MGPVKSHFKVISIGDNARKSIPDNLLKPDSHLGLLAHFAVTTKSTVQSIARSRAPFNKSPGYFQFCLKFPRMVSENANNSTEDAWIMRVARSS